MLEECLFGTVTARLFENELQLEQEIFVSAFNLK